MIKKEDIGLWEDKLKESENYIMYNFKILKNKYQYRYVTIYLSYYS